MIGIILQEFQNKFSVQLVSNVHSYNEGGDIDVLALQSQYNDISSYFKKKEFVVFGKSKSTFYACYFELGNLYVINVVFPDELEYHVLRFYPDVAFKPRFVETIFHDSQLEKFIRYTFQLRKHKSRYAEFVQQYFPTYGVYLSDTTYFTKPVFKKSVTSKQVTSAMNRNLISLVRIFTAPRLAKMCLVVMGIHLKKLGRGKVVAFVGADGSGKTTAIKKTYKLMGVHKMYMGDVNFKLQVFYDWLLGQHIVLARVTYFFMFIENWCRYILIWLRKVKGDTIYTDRWPGLNQHLRTNNKKMKVHDWLYIFFPCADYYIFLSGDPVVIHSRKPELSTDEIDKLQHNLRNRLKRHCYVEINETNLDKALKKTLSILVDINK